MHAPTDADAGTAFDPACIAALKSDLGKPGDTVAAA